MNQMPGIKFYPQYYYYIKIINIITFFYLITILPATAQISPDRTLPTSSEVLPGAKQELDFLITGGTTAGKNLFHSFEKFSVPSNGSVIFKNDPNVANIINRVTGGLESNINGLIQTQGRANFFLINPNGIIFGPNASLDIGGSFIGSTASSIKLSNGDEFSASNPQEPLLSISVPLGLQFGHKTGDIVNQSQVTDVLGEPVGLVGFPNTTLAFVGGEVKGIGGNIVVPDGRIELGSVETNSFVSLTPNSQGFALGYAEDQKFQDIHLKGSLLNVTGFNGGGQIQLQGRTVNLNQSRLLAETSSLGTENIGGISIKGNQLNINNSRVQSITSGVLQGGDITFEAKKVILQGAMAIVSTETKNIGNGGKLSIYADDVQLNDLSILGTQSSGLGNAGDVLIAAQKVTIRDGAQVAINVLAEGSGGKLVVKASEFIDLVGEGELFGDRFFSALVAETRGRGKAAEVSLETGKLSIRDGASISASTFADGDAGKVNIQATEVELIGTGINGKSSVVLSQVQPTANGLGGDITFATENLRIQDGAQVSVSTLGLGNAGHIIVNAPQSVEVQGEASDSAFSGLFAQVDGISDTPSATGRGGDIFLDTGKLILQGAKVRVSATTLDAGLGGNVSIKTKDLLVRDGAQIQAATRGLADGGKVEVTADNIQLIGKNIVPSALVTSTRGNASAGNLTVNTQNLSIQDGGRISASTFGGGRGGEININAFEIKLIGSSASGEFPSGLFTEAQGWGDGGKLNINTEKLLVTNGAIVSADTFGGIGGSIELTANSLEVSNGGQFRTNTASNSNAGNITMKVRDGILLTGTDSGIFASTTADSQGNGGKIEINPMSFIIQDGATIAVDSQGTGTGGHIKLVAEELALNRGKISAETRSNTGGDITLQLQELLLLRNSSQISTSAGNQQFGGDGGNITISSLFIVAPPIENSDITANAFTGGGGNIQIITDGLFGLNFQKKLTNLSDITASSTFGVNGIVEINSPDADASKGLVELPEKVTDASKLIAQGCKATSGEVASKFFITGRGGLPSSPDSIFSGNGILHDLATTPIIGTNNTTNLYTASASPRTIPPPTDSIVEAQGIVVNDKGEIFLAAHHRSWLPPRICHGS